MLLPFCLVDEKNSGQSKENGELLWILTLSKASVVLDLVFLISDDLDNDSMNIFFKI